jgi:hypothetical protein
MTVVKQSWGTKCGWHCSFILCWLHQDICFSFTVALITVTVSSACTYVFHCSGTAATTCHGKICMLLTFTMLGSSYNRDVAMEPTLALEWNSQVQAAVGNPEWSNGGVICGARNKACMCAGSACGDFSA